MKKIIYLAIISFAVFQFFSKTDLASAQSCSGQGGICAPVATCASGYSLITGSGCPNVSDLCCRANPTCASSGGTCIPPGDNCPSGWLAQTAAVTCPVSGSTCCVQGSSVNPPSNTPSATTGTTIVFANPLGFNTVEGLLARVMGTLQGIIVVLALIFFIWAAIVYVTSAGNDERVKSAKSGMTAAAVGLALGIAAPSILKTIAMILDWNGEQSALADSPTFVEISLRVLDFLLGTVGTLGLIMLVIGGVMYFGAAADEENVKSAKKTIRYAIMGIALALASMVIVRQIAALLS